MGEVSDVAPGIYEALVTEGLAARLDDVSNRLAATTRSLASAEAPDRIAWHLSRQIDRVLNDVTDADRATVGLQVARALLTTLGELVSTDPQRTRRRRRRLIAARAQPARKVS